MAMVWPFNGRHHKEVLYSRLCDAINRFASAASTFAVQRFW